MKKMSRLTSLFDANTFSPAVSSTAYPEAVGQKNNNFVKNAIISPAQNNDNNIATKSHNSRANKTTAFNKPPSKSVLKF